MKRVVFLTNISSPYRVRFFDELSKYMDVTVLYYELSSAVKDRNAAWFEEGKGGCHSVQLKKWFTLGGEAFSPNVISWLKKKYDYYVICGYSSMTSMLAMAWLRAYRIPFYMEVDGGLIREGENRIKYTFKKSLVQMADYWLSTGAETTRFLVHYGASRERVLEYPFSSLNEEDILPQIISREEKKQIRAELGIGEEKMVLAVGQFIHRKGFDVLIRSAAMLDEDTGIYIVGGEVTEEYQTLCRELSLSNVHFLGFQKKERLLQFYHGADLFVLPTREDIWGLVINEALACGLPTVTTDRCVAGLELIRDGVNGYIVPVEDVDTLARRIREVLSSDLDAMGEAALASVRPYTIEAMAKVHGEIFDCGR